MYVVDTSNRKKETLKHVCLPSQEVVQVEDCAADHGEDQRAALRGIVDQVVEEVILDEAQELGMLANGLAAQLDGRV
jgi:hypothetical protein